MTFIPETNYINDDPKRFWKRVSWLREGVARSPFARNCQTVDIWNNAALHVNTVSSTVCFAFCINQKKDNSSNYSHVRSIPSATNAVSLIGVEMPLGINWINVQWKCIRETLKVVYWLTRGSNGGRLRPVSKPCNRITYSNHFNALILVNSFAPWLFFSHARQTNSRG